MGGGGLKFRLIRFRRHPPPLSFPTLVSANIGPLVTRLGPYQTAVGPTGANSGFQGVGQKPAPKCSQPV